MTTRARPGDRQAGTQKRIRGTPRRLFVQDLSQLKGLYRQWGTFLSTAVLQVFGTQDHDTAKYVSDALRAGTIKVDSESRSVSRRGAETSAVSDIITG
ncbi:TraM recognition domain-containing protein [Myxococcota bacterium]